MNLPARRMAIADIFEALTAVDRAYKKGKRLSESLQIMATMCRDAHLDPQLFGLFVRTKIYRRYAERFMQAQQIDEVDERAVLSQAGRAGGRTGHPLGLISLCRIRRSCRRAGSEGPHGR
jgi:hypothetical protein